MKDSTSVLNNRKGSRLKFLASLAMTGCALLLLDLGSLAFGQTWWDCTWAYRRELTFDNSGQSDTLLDFTVLVKLSSSNFDYLHGKSDGTDLRFVDEDGSTELKYHIEDWDTSGTSFVWVKVTQIDGSSSADFIWMYYGNLSASDVQDTNGTYDSNYVGVWHLNDGDSTVADFYRDATANNEHGTLTDDDGDSKAADGKIAGAFDFNGDNDCITVDSFSQYLTTAMTIAGWVNPASDSPPNFDGYFGIRNLDLNHSFYILQLKESANLECRFRNSEGSQAWAVNPGPVSAGTWVYLVLTYDGDSLLGYADGDLEDSRTPNGGFASSEFPFRMGSDGKTANYLDGTVDEVRVSNVARTAGWIKAQYLSMVDSLITFRNEEENPWKPAVPTLLSPFANEKVGETTPGFELQSTDPDADAIEYQIEWDTDYAFGSPTTKSSSDYPGDAGWTAATFPSGDTVTYTVQSGDGLSNDSTYWWKVRARDPSGTNLWSSWSAKRSLSIDTTVTLTTWFQTTDEQFDTDTKNHVQTYGSDQVRLNQNGGFETVFFETFPNVADPWDGTGQDESWTIVSCSDIQVTDEAAGSPSNTPSAMWEDADNGFRTPEDAEIFYASIDLSAYNNVDIEYYWQTDDVDPGEGFRCAYSTNSTNGIDGDWTLMYEQLDPTDDTWFKDGPYDLPDVACVSNFKLRFSALFNHARKENIWIDDVKITGTVAPASCGALTSTVIDWSWFSGEYGWGEVSWNDDETTGDVKYQVYYDVSGTPTIIPDGALSGNSPGFDNSPIDISGLDTTTYDKLYIKANLADVGGTPILQDWTCEAVEIPTIAGVARAASDGDITISWESVSGRNYDVYYSDTLQGTYTDVADVAASGDTTSWVDDGSATGIHPDSVVARFYRIECQTGGMTKSTVGKMKRSIVSGMQLVSNPLVPFDSSIQSVLGGQLSGAPDEGYADRVWKYDTEINDYVFAWLVDGVGEPYDGKWWDSEHFQESTMDLGPDCGFWIQSRNGTQDITFVGQVSDTSDRVISIVSGMQLIGSAYPDTVLLKDSELYEDGATGAPNELNADRVWWWDPDLLYYDYAWLVDSTGSPNDGLWWDSDPWGETSITLRPSQGYWYQPRGNPFSWSYPKPYNVPPNL